MVPESCHLMQPELSVAGPRLFVMGPSSTDGALLLHPEGRPPAGTVLSHHDEDTGDGGASARRNPETLRTLRARPSAAEGTW